MRLCLGSRSVKLWSTFQVEGYFVVAGVVRHPDGEGVVPLTGLVVRLLADRVGLTDGLFTALTRRGFLPGHDRGQVWVDVATMLTAGGEAIADIDILGHHDGVLGPVASAPTVWRSLAEASPAALARFEKGRATVRRRVWGLLPRRSPASIWVIWWWMSTHRADQRHHRCPGSGVDAGGHR